MSSFLIKKADRGGETPFKESSETYNTSLLSDYASTHLLLFHLTDEPIDIIFIT
jgi:hypothetical protein